MILNADVDFSQVIGLSFLNTGTKNKGKDCIDFGFIKEMETSAFNIILHI
jgi:hypothetical protein